MYALKIKRGGRVRVERQRKNSPHKQVGEFLGEDQKMKKYNRLDFFL